VTDTRYQDFSLDQLNICVIHASLYYPPPPRGSARGGARPRWASRHKWLTKTRSEPQGGGVGMEEWMAAVSGRLRGVGARYLTCSADWLGAICGFRHCFVKDETGGALLPGSCGERRIAGAWGLGV